MEKDEISIKVLDRDGMLHFLNIPTDMNLNLMEVCKANEIPVEGTCGGMALCASCQCYIHSKHTIPEKGEEEEAMLSEAFNVKQNSRLGCQISVNKGLDGLYLELAPEEL